MKLRYSVSAKAINGVWPVTDRQENRVLATFSSRSQARKHARDMNRLEGDVQSREIVRHVA